MKTYDLGILAGDGIGPEVTGEAKKCVEAAADKHGFAATWKEYPFGAEYYLQHGEALPRMALDEMAGHNAMLLGAIGDPRVPPGPLEQEILLTLRFHFDQYINLRPAQSFPGIPLPVALPDGERLDVVIVRENTEDLYMGLGGTGSGSCSHRLEAKRGLYALAGNLQLDVSGHLDYGFSLGLMTRPAVERVTRYAFNAARQRGEKKITIISKANAVPHLYGFWDKVTGELAKREFPDMDYATLNVDAACYLMARQPWGWGVVLCPNLFGDIVSDLMSGLAGGLGLAAAGNVGDGLSMFEPVHGSAPTLAGTGKANPLAAILSGAMMLRHLGEKAAATDMEQAVRSYLSGPNPKPIEQGGPATTTQVGDFIRELLR